MQELSHYSIGRNKGASQEKLSHYTNTTDSEDNEPICTLRHNELISSDEARNHASNHEIGHDFKITMFSAFTNSSYRRIGRRS